jgi:hypothetical protein
MGGSAGSAAAAVSSVAGTAGAGGRKSVRSTSSSGAYRTSASSSSGEYSARLSGSLGGLTFLPLAVVSARATGRAHAQRGKLQLHACPCTHSATTDRVAGSQAGAP